VPKNKKSTPERCETHGSVGKGQFVAQKSRLIQVAPSQSRGFGTFFYAQIKGSTGLPHTVLQLPRFQKLRAAQNWTCARGPDRLIFHLEVRPKVL
jgi:hypothetical protein